MKKLKSSYKKYLKSTQTVKRPFTKKMTVFLRQNEKNESFKIKI